MLYRLSAALRPCMPVYLPILPQIPVFIYAAACIRTMAQHSWPGFSGEGALWFTDLTLPAVVLADTGLQLPMGWPGLVLPLSATAVMLTSVHLGFKASGVCVCVWFDRDWGVVIVVTVVRGSRGQRCGSVCWWDHLRPCAANISNQSMALMVLEHVGAESEMA